LTVRTPINLNWAGPGNGNWDTTTLNWDSDNDTVADTNYSVGDNVTFLTRGALQVNLVGTLTPSSVTVNSDTTYVFTTDGSGSIASNARLTKSGTGTLILDTDNAYTGGTTINNGVVQVGDFATRGALGSGPVTNHASLVFNRTGNITL